MQARREEWLLDIGTAALLLGVPLVFGTELADSVEVPKTALFAAGSSVLLAGWWVGASRGRWPWFRRTGVGLWGGLLGLWWALSGLWSLSPHEALVPSLQHLLEALVLNAWIATGTPERWLRWWRFALLAGLIVGGYAWMQRLGLDPFAWSHPHLSRERTISTLGNPNYLALFLVAWLPFALGWLLLHTRGRLRLVGLTAWLFIGGAMILTTTRGAWLASLIAALVWLVAMRFARIDWWRWTVGVGLAGALLLGVLIAVQRNQAGDFTVEDRARSFADESVTVRVFLWRAALGLAAENPVLGIGPASYRYAALAYRNLEPVSARHRQRLPENPHNQWLQVACESGAPGLIMLIGWLISTCSALIRRLSSDGLAVAGLASLAALWTDQLTISADMTASVWWLALSAWAVSAPESPAGSPRAWPGLAIPLLLAGILWPAGWVRAEYRLWWADEWRLRAERATELKQATQEYDRALEYYRLALPIASPARQSEIWSQLGSLYLEAFQRLGPVPELGRLAVLAYGEAVRRAPGNPYYRAYLGKAHEAMGQRAEANQAYREAIARDPYSPVFWAFLGASQAAGGEWLQAEESYRQSLDRYPDHGGTRLEHARALAELKRSQEALTEMKAAVKLDPALEPAAAELRRQYSLGEDPPAVR